MTVLLVGEMYHPAGVDALREKVHVELLEKPSPDQISDRIPAASGVVVRYPTLLRREHILAATNLRVISTSGRGTDAIDIVTATERGIPVVNNPGLSRIAVAEQAVALLLALTRNVRALDAAVRLGQYHIRDSSYQVQIHGKTLGIVGLGKIGSEVARKCQRAFDMRVLAYDPYVPRDSAVAALVPSLDELLAESDFVSLHPELTHETRGMIGRRELLLMKSDAFLVNTSRGPVVDEGELAAALRRRQIAGAALDVFEQEPPSAENPLFGLDNVVLSPHVGGLTRETSRELALMAARQVLQVLAGERPRHLVNPEVWRRRPES